MKFIKSYIATHDALVQHCISNDLAEMAAKRGFCDISDTPFALIPIVSRYRSRWQFDEKGNIIGLKDGEYKEDE